MDNSNNDFVFLRFILILYNKPFFNPGTLHCEMMGYLKKNKLKIATFKGEEVAKWIES